jgi:hypothetical protein
MTVTLYIIHSRTPLIRKLVIRTLVIRTLFIRTLVIRTLVIRVGLDLQVNLSRIRQNYFALILPFIGSSAVEYRGFWIFKSGVVERFRRRLKVKVKLKQSR